MSDKSSSDRQYSFGVHAVKAILKSQNVAVFRVVIARRDERIRSIRDLCNQRKLSVEQMSRDELTRLIGHENHQGVIIEHEGQSEQAPIDVLSHLQSCEAPWLILVLDGVQDPHNLGACLRTADAAAVNAVIAPVDRSASISPVVRKVAAGAADSVNFFQVTNLARTLSQLKEAGVWVYGATDAADAPLYQQDLTGSVALVMGAEGSGIRRLTRDACDGLFSIPMQGSVSSLNVSVATGVTLFEVVRQRLQK